MKIDLDELSIATARRMIDLALQAVDEREPDVFWLAAGAITIKVNADHPALATELWDTAHRKVADIGRAIEIVRELRTLYPETQP